MDIKKIYFDMDGVLADFDRGVAEILGLEPMKQGDRRRTQSWDDKLWAGVRDAGHFYDMLEPMPGAIEMFRTIYEKYKDKCEILTGVPKPKRMVETAGDDKINWVHRLLGEDIVVNIVFREEKPKFCSGKDCILIDDLAKNIRAWEEMGGTGIVHTSAEETMEIIKERGIL